MKVTFVYHSCFVVEFEEVVFVFDYFKGKLPEWDADKKIFFFASHKHADHFALDIFDFREKLKDITFVLSSDIRFTDKYLERHGVSPSVKESIIRVGKCTTSEFTVNGKKLTVETLRSTDEGVAFLIQYSGKTIYHAGDLNWWSWAGESENENEKMGDDYMTEINKLSNRNIDVAFVVLDPRQEERYWWGMDYFLKTAAEVKVVFPMHCWENYEVINQFLKEKASEEYSKKVIKIQQEGDSFHLS